MAENLLTVSALRTTVEAELIRGKLEAAGIPAVLVEPEPAAEGAAAGRVQVQVSQPDFERAMQLLFPIPKMGPAVRAAPPGPPPPERSFPAVPTESLPPMPQAAPMPPPAPMSPVPQAPASPPLPAAPLTGLPPAPRLELPPRLSIPVEGAAPPADAIPRLTVPPAASESPAAAEPSPAASKPTMNGQPAVKGISLPPRRMTRTAAEDGLEVVVPAWDPNTAVRGRGSGAGNRRSATDADDRAARRAWWTAVIGMAVWPLLIYSIGVVLILGFSNRPLSKRGNRFFYGALALNAVFIAAAFVICSMLR